MRLSLLFICALLLGAELRPWLPHLVDGYAHRILRSWRSIAVVPIGSANYHNTQSSIAATSKPFGLKTFEELKRRVAVPGNTTGTLLQLIKFGDEWATTWRISNDSMPGISMLDSVASERGYQRVQGCMANVQIKTRLKPSAAEEQVQRQMLVHVDGMADSRVARGMLALLCTGFTGHSATDVQATSASELCRFFHFDELLPTGRLNGFNNMISLIQQQVREQAFESSPSVEELDFEDEDDDAQQYGSLVPSAVPHFTSESGGSNAISVPLQDRFDEVAVLLSGGVDSSVALALLQQQGYKLRAYYLKIWLEDEVAHLNECPWEEDLNYAQQVCDQLNVPLETVSLQAEYWQHVVQYTFDEARRGRTPNPDVMCNSRVKFGVFYDYIGKYHYRVATGHYAQIKSLESCSNYEEGYSLNSVSDDLSVDGDSELMALVRSPDPVKDQSYFLSNLNQQQLQRCLFPIGHLQKKEVRQLAEKFNLPTKNRKDSQGICFLGKLKFDDFIAHYLGSNPGPIRSYQTDEVIGEHKGLWFHTIGQRKGIGLLLAPRTVHAGPWYVAGKNAACNTLYVTNDLQLVQQPRLRFRVHYINWNIGPPTRLLQCQHGGDYGDEIGGIQMQMKLRHSPHFSTGTVRISGEDDRGMIVTITLHEIDKGIAPGQFAAFYDGDLCIGAGVILDTALDQLDEAKVLD